ncbi:MAG TPA: ATP-binding protein [Rhizomicrobium sp.]|nr:ATP-binding protein [Rhizomicrobium sp.]
MQAGLRHSISTKIFMAFLAMSAIIVGLGAYGYRVLTSAGDMVTRTYDGPLQAINYARAASVDFVQMEQGVLKRKLAAHAERATIDKQIDEYTATFFDDLDVAEERLESPDELTIVKQIRPLVKQWQTAWRKSESEGTDPALDALDAKIMERFDMLIELNADHSFVGRRKSVSAIQDFKSSLWWVTAFAFLFALFVTVFLARRIMMPLKSAVLAANSIAIGEFETQIPKAGKDETGILLHSMTVMQDNIRTLVEREKARAQSAESRLAGALDTSLEGVLLVGPDGRVLVANKPMLAFFPSVDAAKVVGMEFGEVSKIAAADVAGGAALPTPHELGLGRRSRSLGSAERHLNDGRWIRTVGSRTEDGGFIFFVSDITAIREREENSRKAQEAAEAASAAKTRFLTNMSHELRTPLNAIIGFSEIIQQQIFGAIGNARYVEYATDITRSGRHLLDVINSVLEISRSEAGKQKFVAEDVDLRYLLHDCEKMLSDQCVSRKIGFSLREPDMPLLVSGEKAKLRQIFLNLLSNAVKFTESGGAVSVALGSGGGFHWVEVSDTGIGMTAEEIQIALTPFGQVDNRLERKYEGTGLGLPLAQSLTELHGGTLTIGSEPGRGTTVLVRFPRADAQETPEPLAAVS